MTNFLVTLEQNKQLSEFKKPDVEQAVSFVKEEALSIVCDATTEKGRKEITSLARKVSSSKTFIENIGKEKSMIFKRQAKEIDAVRNFASAELDSIRDQILKPVAEFKEREKARIKKHSDNIEAIRALKIIDGTENIADLHERKEKLKLLETGSICYEEFNDVARTNTQEALDSIENRISQLTEMALQAEKLEQERQRLAEEAANLEKQRQEQREKELAEKARQEEIEKARLAAIEKEKEKQLEIDRIEAKRIADIQKAEKEKRDLENKIIEENKRAEEKLEAEKKKAEAERLETARKIKEAEEKTKKEKADAIAKAEKEKQEAIENERKRQADIEAKRKAEELAREKDKENKKKIHNEALEDLVNVTGITKAQAKSVITAIAKKQIRNINLNY